VFLEDASQIKMTLGGAFVASERGEQNFNFDPSIYPTC